jgi:RNA polymerase sigma-32 factor
LSLRIFGWRQIAMGCRGYGLPVNELIGEGNVGMMRAVRRFNPRRRIPPGNVCNVVDSGSNPGILRSHSLVKMGTTNTQKKMFFNLRRLKGQMLVIDDSDLKPEQMTQIAATLDVPAQEVIIANRRLLASDFGLSVPASVDGDGDEWQDWLIGETESQEAMLAGREEFAGRQALLGPAMQTLSEHERHVLAERRSKEEPVTLEELARHYAISHARVHQIEMRALEKLQKSMKEQVARHQHTRH